MRIVSKYHDYYDIGMGLGHDAELAYIRTTRDVLLRADRKDESLEDKVTRDLVAKLPNLPRLWSTYNCSTLAVGFCGKFHPVIVFSYPNNGSSKPVFFYSLEEVDRHMQATLNTRESVIYESRWGYRREAQKLFEKYTAFPELTEPFIVNRSPIVVLPEKHDLNSTKAIWNARLRDYNFERVVNPYQAFQRIEMFLGNLAAPEKPVPPQTDIEKVQSHGMDPKWSFRKMKD